MFVDNRSRPLFPIPQGMLPWQPILGEIGKLTFIWQAGVPKGIEMSQFQLKIFNGNILATFYTNLKKINSVIPKITRLTTVSFLTMRQKCSYLTISESTGPIFSKFSMDPNLSLIHISEPTRPY